MQAAIVGGRAVKVGRPSNMGQAEHFITQFAQEAARYNRVYVSNVHKNLTDDEIKSIFESYGRVLSCSLVRDPNDPENHCVSLLFAQEFSRSMSSLSIFRHFFQYRDKLSRAMASLSMRPRSRWKRRQKSWTASTWVSDQSRLQGKQLLIRRTTFTSFCMYNPSLNTKRYHIKFQSCKRREQIESS